MLLNDEHRLSQILQIIIDNAIKFTSAGSIEIDMNLKKNNGVLLDEHGDSEYIRIDIRDTGCGIDLDKQESLFKIFRNVKLKNKINEGGAGIGLAFCK